MTDRKRERDIEILALCAIGIRGGNATRGEVLERIVGLYGDECEPGLTERISCRRAPELAKTA